MLKKQKQHLILYTNLRDCLLNYDKSCKHFYLDILFNNIYKVIQQEMTHSETLSIIINYKKHKYRNYILNKVSCDNLDMNSLKILLENQKNQIMKKIIKTLIKEKKVRRGIGVNEILLDLAKSVKYVDGFCQFFCFFNINSFMEQYWNKHIAYLDQGKGNDAA